MIEEINTHNFFFYEYFLDMSQVIFEIFKMSTINFATFVNVKKETILYHLSLKLTKKISPRIK